MTVVQADVKHATQTAKPNDPDYDVSADAWNEGHNVTVGVPSDIGSANAEGSSIELARKDHVHAHPQLGSGLHVDSHGRSHDHSLVADGSPIAVAGVPDLPASKITSERFPMARLPDGALNYVIKGVGAGLDPAYGQVGHGELTGVTTSQHHAKTVDDEVYGLIRVGLDANKPSAGVAERWYYATDTGVLYRDTGAAWVEAARAENQIRLAELSEKSHASLMNVTSSQHHVKTADNEVLGLLQYGTLANRPAAGIDRRFYYATNTKQLFLEDGSVWGEIARGETATRLAQLSEKAHGSLTGVTTDQHHAQLHAASHRKGGTDIIGRLLALKFGSEGSTTTSTSYVTIADSDIALNPALFNLTGTLYVKFIYHIKNDTAGQTTYIRVFRQNAGTAVAGSEKSAVGAGWSIVETAWIDWSSESGAESYQIQLKVSGGIGEFNSAIMVLSPVQL